MINPNFMEWLNKFEPFGQNFEAPVFLLEDALVKNAKELKGGHLKLTLSKMGQSLEALWFSPPPAIKNLVANQARGHWALTFQWNYYMGNKKIQALIEDFRIS